MSTYRTTPRGIITPTGNRINYGQLFPRKEKPMDQSKVLQRNMHRDRLGRDGKISKLAETTTIAISRDMKRQTKGEIAYHGGVAVDDLPNVPLKSYEKPIPVHNGMSKASRDKFASNGANNPSLILNDASRLGKPPQKA